MQDFQKSFFVVRVSQIFNVTQRGLNNTSENWTSAASGSTFLPLTEPLICAQVHASCWRRFSLVCLRFLSTFYWFRDKTLSWYSKPNQKADVSHASFILCQPFMSHIHATFSEFKAWYGPGEIWKTSPEASSEWTEKSWTDSISHKVLLFIVAVCSLCFNGLFKFARCRQEFESVSRILTAVRQNDAFSWKPRCQIHQNLVNLTN